MVDAGVGVGLVSYGGRAHLLACLLVWGCGIGHLPRLDFLIERGNICITPYHTLYIYIIPYHTMPIRAITYHTIQPHTISYRTIPYHIIPYHTIPCHTIPYHIWGGGNRCRRRCRIRFIRRMSSCVVAKTCLLIGLCSKACLGWPSSLGGEIPVSCHITPPYHTVPYLITSHPISGWRSDHGRKGTRAAGEPNGRHGQDPVLPSRSFDSREDELLRCYQNRSGVYVFVHSHARDRLGLAPMSGRRQPQNPCRREK